MSQPELQEQVRQLIALSRARAVADETIAYAPQGSASDANLGFLEDVSHRLFTSGLLVPSILRVDGMAVAGRLILRANKSIFFSFSGFDPKWSNYGVATTLMTEILRASIENGDSVANLSFYPNTAKFRWSEQLAFHNDFILVGTRGRSRLAFSLWWQRRALLSLQSAAKWARFRVKYAATDRDRRGPTHVMDDSAQRA